MRRRAFLAASLVVVGCRAPAADDPDVEVPPALEVVIAVARELEALDHPLDVETLTIAVRDPQAFVEDVDGTLRLVANDDYFAEMIALRAASAIEPALASPAALRSEVAAREARGLLAFYNPQSRAIVFREDALPSANGLDVDVARALVHAYQDARMGGIIDSLLAPDASTDEGRAAQCVVEGHAAFVAAAMLAARRGGGPETVEDFALVERSIAGEVEPPCPEGARFIRATYARGGWPAVLRSVSSPPPSSEMLVHANKLDVDFPVNVGLPEWPDAQLGAATLVRDDTLGELVIQRLLLERGWPRDEAFAAATGWDGDRLRVYTLASGSSVVVWRSLWDREEDGLQFRQALSPKQDAPAFFWRVAHRGRLVQAVAAADDGVAAVLRDLLAGEIPPAEEPADVRSTVEAEAKRQ